MIKDAIGIIDVNLESFSIVESLTKNFPHERFIYINDLKNKPYTLKGASEIIDLVKKEVGILLKENIKLLIVASDLIVEYVSDYLNTLTVPVVNIVSTLIEYVNTNYEQKNMVLFAKSEIIEANIYQKNFKYNRLYNIPSNDLEDIINCQMIKTSKSFYTTKETFKILNKKDIDVIITSSPYLIKLKTELMEYLTFNEITDVGEIISTKIKDDFFNLNVKGNSELLVYSNVNLKQFSKMVYWSNLKYKYIELKDNEKEKV